MTQTKLFPKIEPRGLSRVDAAKYFGISPNLFDECVREKKFPEPKHLHSRKIWDRRELDEAFEALDDATAQANPWDKVLG